MAPNLLVARVMQQPCDSPATPVSEAELDEVLRSLEVELLFPELASPRQGSASTDRAPSVPSA